MKFPERLPDHLARVEIASTPSLSTRLDPDNRFLLLEMGWKQIDSFLSRAGWKCFDRAGSFPELFQGGLEAGREGIRQARFWQVSMSSLRGRSRQFLGVSSPFFPVASSLLPGSGSEFLARLENFQPFLRPLPGDLDAPVRRRITSRQSISSLEDRNFLP